MSKDLAGSMVYVGGKPVGRVIGGGIIPTSSRQFGKGAHMKDNLALAARALYAEQEHLQSLSDDLSDRAGSVASVYMVKDSGMYRVVTKDWDLMTMPRQGDRSGIFYVAVADTKDVLKGMASNTLELAHSKNKDSRYAIWRALLSVSSFRAGSVINTAVSLGVESPMITDYLAADPWSKHIEVLKINAAPSVEVSINSNFSMDEGSPIKEVTVSVGWEPPRFSYTLAANVIAVRDGATYSLHDLLLKFLNDGDAPSNSSRCRICNNQPIRKPYLEALEEVTVSNILLPILIRNGFACPSCIYKKVKEAKVAEEYLAEGAVPNF